MANNDNTIKRSPLHDDLQAAGYQHQTTSPYNGLAKHTYSGTGGYSPVLKKHGYQQITDTVWKHKTADDSVQLRPADQGHKLVHTHHDKSYQYPNEDVEHKVGEMLEFEMEGNLTVESKRRMTDMFVEVAAKFAAEAVSELVEAQNETVELVQKLAAWTEMQLTEQEAHQAVLAEALTGLVHDVYTDENDANEFLEAVRRRVQANVASGASDGKVWSSGVDDSAPARNKDSLRPHSRTVRESLSPQTRELLDSKVLTESHQNRSHSNHEKKTLGVMLGSTNLRGRTNTDGSQQRKQTLVEMKQGMTSVDLYCALEDAKKPSWVSGR